jgi:hypothetical protein
MAYSYTKNLHSRKYGVVTPEEHTMILIEILGGEKQYNRLIDTYNKYMPEKDQVENITFLDGNLELYHKGKKYEEQLYIMKDSQIHRLQRESYQTMKQRIHEHKPLLPMFVQLFSNIHNRASGQLLLSEFQKYSYRFNSVEDGESMNVMDALLEYIDNNEVSKIQMDVMNTLMKHGGKFHKYSDPFNTKELTSVEAKSILAESFLHSSKGKTMRRSFTRKNRKTDSLTKFLYDSSSSSSESDRSRSKRRTARRSRSKTKSRSKTRTTSKGKTPSREKIHRGRIRTLRKKHVIVDSDSE